MPDPQLTIVAPIHNEEENLRDFYAGLKQVMAGIGRTYEIVLVDDGSTDGSLAILEDLASRDPDVRVVVFRRNFGQSAALAAGFQFARGEVVVTMDSDLQNDPKDIPNLLRAIEEGADVASGWRVRRQDPWFTRRFPSWAANKLISVVTGVALHDYGCTLKAYRKEAVREIRLYGEMHRFLPAVVSWRGARIVEIEVDHHPRTRGKSKYGLTRIYKVMLDLLTVKFLGSYSSKPIRFFGGAGLLSILCGILTVVVLIARKLVSHEYMIRSPLLLLSALFVIVGVQFVLMGLVAELMIRINYEARGQTPYVLRRTLNIDSPPCADSQA